MSVVVCGSLVRAFRLIFFGRHCLKDVEQFRRCGCPLLYRVFDLGRIVRHIEDDRHGFMLCCDEGYIVVVPEAHCDGFVLFVHYVVVMPNL